MKRSNFDTPQRQSQYAIIFIILKSLQRLVRQIWPIGLAIVLGRGRSSWDTYELVIAGVGLFGIIPAVIAYYKYYFHLSGDELIIERGLLSKTRLNIPFSRIQSVNFKQGPLHQMFDVTEVVIETAGSSEQETQIDALDMETAEALRTRILELKNSSASAKEGLIVDDTSIAETIDTPRQTILSLSLQQLVKIGALQNPFKPIGLLLSLGFTLMFYSYTMDIDFIGRIRSFTRNIEETVITPSEYILGLGVLVALGVLYAIITTIIRHYNLKFWRGAQRFQVEQGLFTRKQYSALDDKIQMLKWGQTWLEKKVDLFKIEFLQARSGGKVEDSEKFEIPGANLEQVQEVQRAWLEHIPTMSKSPVSKHLFYHFAMYAIPVILLICSAAYYFKGWQVSLAIVVIGAWILFIQYLNWQKKSYSLSNELLYIGGGVLGLRNVLLPTYKIQNIALSSSHYERRRGLTSLIVYTAGGAIKIPYIPQDQASSLMDRLLYEVEVSRRAWM